MHLNWNALLTLEESRLPNLLAYNELIHFQVDFGFAKEVTPICLTLHFRSHQSAACPAVGLLLAFSFGGGVWKTALRSLDLTSLQVLEETCLLVEGHLQPLDLIRFWVDANFTKALSISSANSIALVNTWLGCDNLAQMKPLATLTWGALTILHTTIYNLQPTTIYKWSMVFGLENFLVLSSEWLPKYWCFQCSPSSFQLWYWIMPWLLLVEVEHIVTNELESWHGASVHDEKW